MIEKFRDFVADLNLFLQRMTFIRESSSKMYSPYVFALSQLAAEVPYSILCSVVFFLLVRPFSRVFNFYVNPNLTSLFL